VRAVLASRLRRAAARLKPPLRQDLVAGWTSALVMLPQAVMLAALAGLPPEMGVYASVFPVIVAALLGASRRLLSGPNTAVAVMIAAAITPFATPFSAEYGELALVLTVLVGLLQLVGWLARIGCLFEAVPDEVVWGVTLGVGLVIIVSQLSAALGILAVPGEAPWLSAWYAATAWDRANPYAVLVALASIAAGVAVGRSRLRRRVPPLVAALAAGAATGWLLDAAFGRAVVGLDRIGHLSLTLLPFSRPQWSLDELYVIKQLLVSAVAIAAIGCLQTVIIARSLAERTGDPVDSQRELMAQGFANCVAAFTSGFAGSGSFNRSEAHVSAGAQTPRAAVASAVLIFVLVAVAGPALAYLPVAALGGTLILVGWGLAVSCRWPTLFRDNRRAACAVAGIAVLIVGAGLEAAVLWSMGIAAALAVWRQAHARQTGRALIARTRR
jgi:SulP family sulfate permease